MTDDVERTVKDAAANGGQVHRPADGRRRQRPLRNNDRRSRPGRDRCLGAQDREGLRGAERARHRRPGGPSCTRATTTRASALHRERLQVARPHRGRHGRVPLHDPRARATTRSPGLMDPTAYAPEGAPPPWTVYFRVEGRRCHARADRRARRQDRAARRGHAVRPARTAATDPTGTRFKLIAG